MLSIPATKGFEIGSGFSGSELRGSQHNDLFDVEENKIVTSTNHSGGVQGGITNGMPLLARIAFKPTATVLIPQNTLNNNLESTLLQVKGRHDPCVVPRAVVIVEAMAALTLVNFLMEHQARKNLN
jgi:chorismate synthase